jgi:hypothetical protein
MPISDDQKQTYAGIYVLKKLDLKPADGGLELPVLLDGIYSPLESVLERLVIQGHLQIDRKKQRYTITKSGYNYISELIDEAEAVIDEFDEWEVADMVAELHARNLDPLRARFLWGWYQGEFDDLVLYQQRRGVDPVEYEWPLYVTSDAFYADLERDFEDDGEDEDAAN